jgi:hypothetical protein
MPLLPGASAPAAGPFPSVRIYQPPRSVMQSGPGRGRWILEFERTVPPFVDPLTGWVGGADPLAHLRLDFPDMQSAIAFAERHGWRYEIEAGPTGRRMLPKSYADRFRYELADVLWRAEPWRGPMASEPDRAGIGRPAGRATRGGREAAEQAAAARAADAAASPDPVEEASRESFPASDPPA